MPADLAARAWEGLRSGGGVMIPLAGISIWMWTLAAHKARQLRLMRRQSRGRKTRGNNEGGWQDELLTAFKARRTGIPELDARLVHSLEHRFSDRADSHVGAILALAGVAPLLGLLGTVAGMTGSFEAMAVFGAGDVRALASGVSEALVTTQAGLAVAIPGLVAGNWLRRRAIRRKDEIKRFCLFLANRTATARPDCPDCPPNAEARP